MARVLAATRGTPGVGDLWATVPFVLLGLLVVAVTAVRCDRIRLFMWVAFVPMVVVSGGVWIWRWEGWVFYLATAAFVFMVQLFVVRAAGIRGGTRS